MPAIAADPAARQAQIAERGFWMARDIRQTGNNRIVCAEKEELVGLIKANNEGAESSPRSH